MNATERTRNFCFTLNNPTQRENEFLISLTTSAVSRRRVQCVYIVFQQELPTGGTNHLQGYVELSRPMRRSDIKRRFGNRISIRKRHGTGPQAIAYCKKKDTRVEGGLSGEGGTAKKSGADSLAVVTVALKSGQTIEECRHAYPCSFIRYGEKIVSHALREKGLWFGKKHIVIRYGVTNTGKTGPLQKLYPDAYWCPMPRVGGWWWPNYEGQETVIFDEFRDNWPYKEMLRLIDRYPFDVQVKGGNYNMISRRLVFTTNIDPMNWYPNISWENRSPFRRRLNQTATIYDFSKKSTYHKQIFRKRPKPFVGPIRAEISGDEYDKRLEFSGDEDSDIDSDQEVNLVDHTDELDSSDSDDEIDSIPDIVRQIEELVDMLPDDNGRDDRLEDPDSPSDYNQRQWEQVRRQDEHDETAFLNQT